MGKFKTGDRIRRTTGGKSVTKGEVYTFEKYNMHYVVLKEHPEDTNNYLNDFFEFTEHVASGAPPTVKIGYRVNSVEESKAVQDKLLSWGY